MHKCESAYTSRLELTGWPETPSLLPEYLASKCFDFVSVRASILFVAHVKCECGSDFSEVDVLL